MQKGEKIFVTGASGFIGSCLIRQLLADGFLVRGMSRHRPTFPIGFEEDSQALWEHPNFEYFAGDIMDRQALQQAMAGCDYVVHLAGYAKNYARDPETFMRVNVDGMENVFDAAKENGIKKIVWTSSIVAFGPTARGKIGDEAMPRLTEKFLTDYERSKTIAQKRAQQRAADEGLPVVIVNPTRVFGPGPLSEGNALSALINDYDQGRFPFMINFGKNIGNYGYVQDVARGLYLALEHGRVGECYLLGGENISMLGLFETIDKISGKQHFKLKIYVLVPLLVAWVLKNWAILTGHYPKITPGWVRVFSTDAAFSCDKAVRELGYTITPLEQALSETYNWIIKNRKTIES